MSEDLVRFKMTADYCSWCEQGDKPKHLDQDGVLISITGKPGYLCHAQDDFWWPCVPSIRHEAQAEQKKRDAEKYKELIAAGEEVSTRWLENRLTKTEIGRLGRAIVAAIKGASNMSRKAETELRKAKAMTQEEWFAQIAHAASVALDSPITVETVAEWEKKYPVMKDGLQVGFLVPVKTGGEFQVLIYDDLDFAKFDFRVEAR